ncbi:hypothetical protein CO172_01085, partial [Candidatus Uhrbacteria bacterium CG_4_9_14_3_um_filter_36_7]
MKWLLIKIIIICFPLMLFLWIFWQNLVPTGAFKIIYPIGTTSSFIDPIVPKLRVSDLIGLQDGSKVQQITGDPTYFFIHPHRSFKTV